MNGAELHAHPLGDRGVTISFGEHRSPELLRRIHAAARAVRAGAIPNVMDVVPSYVALTAFYNPLNASYEEMAAGLVELCNGTPTPSDSDESSARLHVVPVRYDGVDLESVARATGLTTGEIVTLHSGRSYTVDILGFVPGFGYLSELDSALQVPRRPQPRPRVAAGSVAIAGAQTAVYPLDTPGGWHIIGTTDLVMFDPHREPAALLAPGDVVRFEPLT